MRPYIGFISVLLIFLIYTGCVDEISVQTTDEKTSVVTPNENVKDLNLIAPESTLVPRISYPSGPNPSMENHSLLSESINSTVTDVKSMAINKTSGTSLAPDFSLSVFNGGELRLSDLRGQVVVLNFWASWCPSCRWEMAAFERVYQDYRDEGVMFVGVAVSDSKEDAEAFADLTGVTYPIGNDLSKIAQDYKVVSLPTTVFINTEGEVARTLRNVANDAVLRLFIDGQMPRRNIWIDRVDIATIP